MSFTGGKRTGTSDSRVMRARRMSIKQCFNFFTNMCRLMTTQLAEALEGYPLYSQDGKGKEAVCRAIFALGSVRWFILEGNREDDDVILFGIRMWSLT